MFMNKIIKNFLNYKQRNLFIILMSLLYETKQSIKRRSKFNFSKINNIEQNSFICLDSRDDIDFLLFFKLNICSIYIIIIVLYLLFYIAYHCNILKHIMKALHIAKYGRFPVLTNCQIPQRDQDTVIAKIHYAPVNPSDLNFYQGKYGIRKSGFPIVGFQGSGIICDAENKALINRKVSFIADSTNGTHATHIKTSIKNCMIWPDDIDTSKISSSWINPLSCIGLSEIIQKEEPKNVLISAATSQLGLMLIRIIKKKWPQIHTIGLSRSKTNEEKLTSFGLKKFIQTGQSLHQELKTISGKTVYLDCVGGQFCGQIFNILPQNSVMICYGRLSGQPLGKVDLGSLYYQNKSIRGFWLNTWFSQQNESQLQRKKSDVVRHFETFYNSEVRQIYKLQNFMDAYRASIKNQSLGKILLSMN